MADAKPYPKEAQLARGPKRYPRKVATKKGWERITAQKMGPCRVCVSREHVQLHHLVFRGHFGDDLADNIVPVCDLCHQALHERRAQIARLLLTRLSDAEYSYMVTRGGEDYAERTYGIEYGR